MKKINLKTYAAEIDCPDNAVIQFYLKYAGSGKGILLESSEKSKGRYTFMARNPVAEIIAGNNSAVIIENGVSRKINGRFLDITRDYIAQFNIKETTSLPFSGGAAGIIGYDIVKQYEKLPAENHDEINTPDGHLLFFRELIAIDHIRGKCTLIAIESDDNEGMDKAEQKIREIKAALFSNENMDYSIFSNRNPIKMASNTTKEEYMDKVKKAKQYIKEGDIFQVVLSQRFSAPVAEHPLGLYNRLRNNNNSPYLYYLNFGEYQIAGCSPELLVEVREDKITSCPIAGTVHRGRNDDDDKLLIRTLLTDPKEQAEHIMLVDLSRNDVGRVSNIGSVKVSDLMAVKCYSHVIHLASTVEGIRRPEKDSFDVLSSCLPAGTLSGAPKIRAMEIIEELETNKRGIYGGAIGYFNYNGNMDTCIAIRTMVIKNGSVYIQAGAGIVADSDPEKEYSETLAKARALINVIEGGN